MTTGRETMVENSRERLVSSDVNRMQTFIGAIANELLRAQVLRPVDDTAYAGVTLKAPGPANTLAIDVDRPTTPLYGAVLDGVMVVVPAAGTSFLITPGHAILIDPDGFPGSSDPNPANPDDPIAKVVQVPGIDATGVLNWTPNAGPGIRVDVIECQRTSVVSETDNRDIFNPATGLFTPQSVTKVITGDLAYRVRTGAPGGGLPAPALGWLPLAIVATPAGALDLDACTVWDVRWLASDMAEPFAAVKPFDSRTIRRKWFNDQRTAPGELRLSGQSLANYAGFKIGGLFYEMSTPGQLYIDLNNPFYRATGFAPVASSIYYVYSLWPGGYVRWVRYYQTATASQGGRVPGSFRGIPTVSHVPPFLGVPTAPIAPSALWGLGVSTQLGRTVASGVVDTGAVMRGGADDGDMVNLQFTDNAGVSYSVLPAVLAGGNAADWTLVPGVHFPAGSNRIRVVFQMLYTPLPTAGDSVLLTRRLDLWNPTVNQSYLEAFFRSAVGIQTSSTPLILNDAETAEIPVGADGLSVPGPIVYRGTFDAFPGSAPAPTLTQAILSVIGWDSP